MKSTAKFRLNCPICKAGVNLDQGNAQCASGHHFTVKHGVVQLLTPEFKEKLEAFLNAFEHYRKPYMDKVNPYKFMDLPFVDFDRGLWNLRQLDLKLVNKYKQKCGEALDLGAWTGWLSNRLVNMGFNVTAVDYFIHPLDGLGAHHYYKNNWLTVQINLNDLSTLSQNFDLIVVNRSIQYFADLEETIKQLKTMLNPGGVLLISGVTYLKNPITLINRLNDIIFNFEQKYNTPFKIADYKGYLDANDLEVIKKMNVKLSYYPGLKFKSQLGHFLSNKHFYYYGYYKKD